MSKLSNQGWEQTSQNSHYSDETLAEKMGKKVERKSKAIRKKRQSKAGVMEHLPGLDKNNMNK